MEPPDDSRSPPHLPTPSHDRSDESVRSQGRKRVGFTTDAAALSVRSPSPRTPNQEIPDPLSAANSPLPSPHPEVNHELLSAEIHRAFGEPYIPKPRPAIRKTARTPPKFYVGEEDPEEDDEQKRRSGIAAQQRATKLARAVGTYSAPGSRRNSQDRLFPGTSSIQENIPMKELGQPDMAETSDNSEAYEAEAPLSNQDFMEQAGELLRHHTLRGPPIIQSDDLYHETGSIRSGQATPMPAEAEAERVPRPPKYRTGVLGTLLRASAANHVPLGANRTPKRRHGRDTSQSSTFSTTSTAAGSPFSSPPLSGTTTPLPGYDGPRPWYSRSANNSSTSISKLKDAGQGMAEQLKKQRPKHKRTKSSASLTSAFGKLAKPTDESIKIKIHLAGVLARQTYLRRLCKALMMYGAPTHRLEEYMNMSARVLEIEAQFLYIPGCMIISFDDSSVHTTEVKLVRCAQGIDLGKLRDVHEIYKDVVHDRIGVEEATPRLEAIIARDPKYNNWLRVPIYGLASASVGPFAFQARPIDLPFCFILGCILGWLQLIVAPQNELLSNVFEISAAVITSFIARGLGSIRHDGKELFCFSAMAQSSIALILPGFTVLSASLELQSRHIVAGSVRMVYAIIYSLFLGFGITIGTVLFGIMDHNATSATSCSNPMDPKWYYFFVLAFSLCLMVINQAKWKQVPPMLVIALIGYAANYHSSRYFRGNAQVSNTVGALAIGISANLHARFGRHVENWSLDFWEYRLRPRWVRLRKRYLRGRHGRHLSWLNQPSTHPSPYVTPSSSHPASSAESIFIPATRKIGYGLAAASMLPAIFVQVPSGLSVSGSLVSGIISADQITRNATGVTTLSNGTDITSNVNNVALKVGFSVIQVAIGITVGLFLAALIVYPLGKKRSGLFSF
ncbi:DUF1212-domain-containing protein [Delitschia confertaspora ATCC 74209]|uniref:DUF1212-domain-containing protein n=1 Tax=Delitschia confertaspora ATCC 74209 TaxID=1513339 RepID=A0A9P4JQ79_9PLEO|nr:DUF1212-domain-containing protein [Delitschia confertaspora ATCC 74209]